MSDKERDELVFNCFVIVLAIAVALEAVSWTTGQQAPIEYLARLVVEAMR